MSDTYPSTGEIIIPETKENTSESKDEDLHARLPSSERLGQQNLLGVVESYLKYYASGDGHTAKAKQYDLKYFIEFLSQENSLPIERIPVAVWTMQATKDYVDQRLSLGEAPTTVNRRLATLKHFGRTLAERVHGFINPAREVKGPSISASKPHGLSADEINLLKQAAEQEVLRKSGSFISIRNQFLMELLFATGLRADEVRLLLIAQIDDQLEWLKNVRTKGRKFRNVYVESSIRSLFKDYLIARERELLRQHPGFLDLPEKTRARFPVLISLYGSRIEDPKSYGLAPKSIWRVVSSIGKLASSLSTSSLPNLHPHKLRHTFAHGLLDSSKDVRLVAQALGHSDVRTTMRYTERSEEQLAKAIEAKRDKD